MEEKNKSKLNFFKNIWYSIVNFEKYVEFKEETVKKSIKYLVLFTVIGALILAIFPTYSSYKFLSDGVNYIQNNIPEFKYETGILSVEAEEPILIENNFIKYLSNGYNLVIDTNLEDEAKIQEDVEKIEGNKKAILLKDKIITYDNDEKTSEYGYQEVINNFLLYEKTSFNKEDVINYFSTPFYYYYINNFISYVISLIITFLLINLIISVIMFAYCKMSKENINFKEIYSISCHAATLPIIIYLSCMILNYISRVQIKYIDIIYVIITCIYVITVISIIKNNKDNDKNSK